jgi:hypothetical protein
VLVFSEVVFITVKLLTGKKAYELRRTPETVKEAAKTMTHHLQFLQEYFIELEVNSEVKELAVKVMEKYGLLPNDSRIAATCRYYGVNTILTFDEDFKRIPWLKVVP